jgi:hypothetical protein
LQCLSFVLMYICLHVVRRSTERGTYGKIRTVWTESDKLSKCFHRIVRLDKLVSKPGYNDISLCETSSITPDILWYQFIPSC